MAEKKGMHILKLEDCKSNDEFNAVGKMIGAGTTRDGLTQLNLSNVPAEQLEAAKKLAPVKAV